MDIVERARSIIINPGPTWQVIEQEPVANPQALYVPYMVILAAIPAVATFIGMSLVGMGGFGFSIRLPIISGLGMMITQYVLTLVMVFVWAWLVNALAGTFGGQANLLNALKLTIYGSTPGMVAGVFHVLPGTLSILALVGSLYGLYVIYLGLPVLMKNPPEKSVPYMAVVVVVGIVCMVVISAIGAIFTPSPVGRMGSMVGDASNGISISTPQGEVKLSATPGAATAQSGNAAVTIKTPDGEVKLDAKNMEEFAKRMEAMASAAAAAAEKSKTQ